MKKWCAIAFGVYGYMLVVWYFWSYLWPEAVRYRVWDFVRSTCPMCIHIVTLDGEHWVRKLLSRLLILAPLNALLYAAGGFLLGLVIDKIRRVVKQA